MKILIAGGTGFIGQYLTSHFLKSGNGVTILSRTPSRAFEIFSNKIDAINWDEVKSPSFNLTNFDLVINLCGLDIAQKNWSESQKRRLLDSRIIPTRLLSELCAKHKEKSPALFNASGVGIYGLESGPKDTFMQYLAESREAASKAAIDAGVRVIEMRFGAVLGRTGGMLSTLLPIFKLGLGGKMGTGKQPVPWICIEDVACAIDFLIEHKFITGPVEFVAPQILSQYEFAKTLAKALNRPAFFTTPAFLLKLKYGQLAEELILNGQRVKPSRLVDNGFQFRYPTLDKALEYLL